MKRIPLRENWFMASERDVFHADPAKADYKPGHAMVKDGRAPSPWRDWDAKALWPLEKENWWFRHEFELPEDAAEYDAWELQFEGLSLFATIWVNGDPLGYTRNAHHTHSVDITNHVNASQPNVLAINCGLQIDHVKSGERPEIRIGADGMRAYVRMPHMSHGWDFAPHLLLVGPWRPITLVGHRRASIADAHVRTDSLDGDAANITVAARLRQFGKHTQAPKLRLSIHEDPDATPVWSDTVEVYGDGSVEVPVTLPSARLWYPQPLGEPFLYTLKATVECDGEQVDEQTSTFGVRTIEVRRDGEFTFVVNGQEVFAKGANWVPPHSLTWDTTEDQCRHLIELAADANFNMFRMWGGGIYDSECFYDLCDRHGIMIWQDFMCANTMVPDDNPAYMESLVREAEAAVTRLRRHPCLAMWCGNNECLEAWDVGEWPDRTHRHRGACMYFTIFPRIVGQLSPGTPYWPGSPCGGSTRRSRTVGDFHDWYSIPNWRTYDENAPLFSSEYGLRGVPQRETVDQMISPEFQWDAHGPQHVTWQFHHGYCGSMQQILPEFGDPKTLDEYIERTQEMQATVMQYAVEVYRRRMYGTSGSLIWQYNEPWPAVTFAIVDFYGRAKASYYWVRRAYDPVMGMFYLKDGALSFWGVNDLREDKPCTVRIRRFSHAGELLGEASFDGVAAANGATHLVEALPESLRIQVGEDEFLHGELRHGDVVSERVYHSAFRKDWRLPQANLTATCERVDGETLRVTLNSPGYVHFVGLTVVDPHARFSDNFVDLLPNEPRTIEVRTGETAPITVRAANAETLVLDTK